jgi:acyl-CoA reductase-like NAD-dependent aldehyde dehydrogenase
MASSIIRPWIDGRPAGGRARTSEPVTRPWDGRLLAQVELARPGDLDRAIAGAQRGFDTMRLLPAHRRRAILLAAADGLRRDRAAFGKLMSDDAGKPITLALGEVDRAIATFTIAAEELRQFGGEFPPADIDPRGEPFQALTRRFPVGPIAAIAPFNFPLNLVVHKVAPAIAVGSSVVLKVPPQAPLAAFRLARLLAEAGLPEGALQVLHMPIPVAERLATDPAFAMLSFTGSPAVGWHLKTLAGRKRVTLELGGNAAAVVHSDAVNLPEVAARIAWGAFAYSGQVCIKVQRLLVHAPLYRRFVRMVVAATRALKVGDPSDPATVVGPLIDDAAADRVQAWIREAVGEGALPLLRGRRRQRLVAPTILERVRHDSKVSCREVFGPVLTVAPYRTWDEALRLVNDSEFGLQAGVFTAEAARVFEAWQRLDVGGVVANDIPSVRLDHLPYGGVKSSGFGREGLREAMREMSEPRLLLWRTGAGQ